MMNHLTHVQFPRGDKLYQFLDLEVHTPLEDLFERILENPIQDLFARPKKSIRSHLIDLGFDFCKNEKLDLTVTHSLYEVLELLHAGSLIIDDIEDNSVSRRGRPTVHRTYGVPVALNAGNWLYFLPFQVIDQMNISSVAKAELKNHCQQTLLRAHYGQALDVGIEVDTIPQDRVLSVVKSSLELKSGVLTSFALSAASLALEQELHPKLLRWGRRFGKALQMFDDIGNFTAAKNSDKRFEDLKLKRLSYIHATLAQELAPQEYRHFWSLWREEKLAEMVDVIYQAQVPQIAQKNAQAYLNELIEEMKQDAIPERAYLKILELKNILVGAYE